MGDCSAGAGASRQTRKAGSDALVWRPAYRGGGTCFAAGHGSDPGQGDALRSGVSRRGQVPRQRPQSRSGKPLNRLLTLVARDLILSVTVPTSAHLAVFVARRVQTGLRGKRRLVTGPLFRSRDHEEKDSGQCEKAPEEGPGQHLERWIVDPRLVAESRVHKQDEAEAD